MIDHLNKHVLTQMKNILCYEDAEGAAAVERSVKVAHDKTLFCLSKQIGKYSGQFSVYNSCHYAIFLYYLSNDLSKSRRDIADVVYCLNKALNGFDVFHSIELPDVFNWEHPVGTVLGRAKYSNNFLVYQNCTVGGNFADGQIHYPVIGKNVTMFSYSCMLGKCTIGDNVIISSHAYLKDVDIPSNSIVFGSSPNLIIKENKLKLKSFID